jgi:hypothetical protein
VKGEIHVKLYRIHSGEPVHELAWTIEYATHAGIVRLRPAAGIAANAVSAWRHRRSSSLRHSGLGPAAMVAALDAARVVLEHGASPNWRDQNGDTALHRVIKSRIIRDPTKGRRAST